MIRNSFIFLDKISTKTEQSLWQQGIKDWQNFLQTKKIKGISQLRKYHYDRQIKEAQIQLLNENTSYFKKNLPQKETWRLYNYFKEETCYVDIEVDSKGKVILVGLADEYQTKTFVHGANLTTNILQKQLAHYKLVITFNGSAFDLPKLKKQLNLTFPMPHLDLKPLCINLNLIGGLKEVEKKLSISRHPKLKGNPVDLWKAFHASGDKEWLELLIDYNKEDIENLRWITDYCYQKLSKKIYKQ